MEALLETIKFDHGYTRDSAAVGHLARTLAELDAADQRRFVRFVTGSPRLPPGGIAALQVSSGMLTKRTLTPGCLMCHIRLALNGAVRSTL